MLYCKRFRGRHTAVNIAHYYQEATTAYKIDNEVITVVTDNASNVTKAFCLPGFNDTGEHEASCSSDDEEDDEILDDLNLEFEVKFGSPDNLVDKPIHSRP